VRVFQQRCKTCQTLYQSRMTRVLAMGLLLILAAPFASAKSKRCTVRVHAQGNENDGSAFATPVTTPISGKNIFIEKNTRNFRARRFRVSALYGERREFRRFTATRRSRPPRPRYLSVERRGGTLLIFVNGRIITELLVIDAFPMVRFYCFGFKRCRYRINAKNVAANRR